MSLDYAGTDCLDFVASLVDSQTRGKEVRGTQGIKVFALQELVL